MTEELSPSDRSSLAAERGPVNMAVGGLLVFDAEPELTRAIVTERLAARLHLIPRLRQRLEEPPLGLAINPVWTDDTTFDLDWHVRQASLPAPGGEAELARAMGSVRAFNLVVSNIPGPQQPFYLDGVRMREIYPIVPLNPANQGLSVGIISYDGQVCFGLLADRDLEPPLQLAAERLRAALAELPDRAPT
jgi:hypothetical protein